MTPMIFKLWLKIKYINVQSNTRLQKNVQKSRVSTCAHQESSYKNDYFFKKMDPWTWRDHPYVKINSNAVGHLQEISTLMYTCTHLHNRPRSGFFYSVSSCQTAGLIFLYLNIFKVVMNYINNNNFHLYNRHSSNVKILYLIWKCCMYLVWGNAGLFFIHTRNF